MKKSVGRNQIKVIQSVPYSEIIFLVSMGHNYALKIAEERGRQDSSPTAKQLKQLEEKGFLEAHKEKLLNKTIYDVNWEKIIQEFINFLEQAIEHTNLEDQLTSETFGKNIEEFGYVADLMKDKDFLRRLTKNVYLQTYFKEFCASVGYFKHITNLANVFRFIITQGSLNYFDDIRGFNKIYSIDNFLKVTHKTNSKNRISVLENNQELEDLRALNFVFIIAKIQPIFQISLNAASNTTGKKIFREVLSKEGFDNGTIDKHIERELNKRKKS